MGRPPLELGTYGDITALLVNGRWRARARYRDADGHTRVVERWASSKTSAKVALTTALKAREHSDDADDLTAESTINELLTVWWTLKQQISTKLSAGTRASYEDIMRRIIVPGIGGLRIREATTKRLDRWLITEHAIRASQTDLARTILRQAFDLAAQWDLRESNPARAVSKFERRVNAPRGLTVEELTIWRDQLRGVRQNQWIADLSEVQLGLALRIGEPLALKVDALDLENPLGPRVRIQATVITPHGLPHAWQPHTKDGPDGRRTVIAPDWVADILRRRALLVGPSGLLFASRNDTLLSPHNVREAWRRERSRAGLEWMKPHSLRKTSLSKISSVYGTSVASKFADHKTVAVTETYYIEAAENIGPDVRKALDELAPRPEPTT